jgi:S-adenosylmethionine:tRNA ribosyltransferase-isomerase
VATTGISHELTADEFDFDLPAGAIALRPAQPRDAARLLVVDPAGGGALADHRVSDLPGLLRAGDVLVFNDTRVLPAQLFGQRVGRGDDIAIALTLMEPAGQGAWRAFAKPGRRLMPGDRIAIGGDREALIEVRAKEEGGLVAVAAEAGGLALEEVMRRFGVAPLPPYIAARRKADARDTQDYQTVYAARDGAVAAPTAGLHFTPELLAHLDAAGIARVFLTLHVGAGTFLPVKSDRIADHSMHAEWGEISAHAAARINAARDEGGRIVAVGTTVLRLLESSVTPDGRITPFQGETSIFIAPGHRIRSADILLTNFHLPKSTLLMLVSAFTGTALIKRAYAHAVSSGYRFYSYGDACLLFRADAP